LQGWHDFYALLGAAAATLVGLTFVAASIAAGTVKREHAPALNIFITPTVVHFTAILVACLLILAPFADPSSQGFLLLAGSAGGAVYSAVVLIEMRRRGYAATVDVRDRLWYALAPVLAYVVVAAGALLRGIGARHGTAVLAVGFALLLFAGIRNAWDMLIFTVIRRG
jgi:hypothetical protein